MTTLTISIDQSLKQEIAELAKQQGESMSRFVSRSLRLNIRKKPQSKAAEFLEEHRQLREDYRLGKVKAYDNVEEMMSDISKKNNKATLRKKYKNKADEFLAEHRQLRADCLAGKVKIYDTAEEALNDILNEKDE